ncbi:MFS transporter [Salinisphaera aquimarina]|uniref:MFS transporter n=1 Tax=Salinisphaera aquimarina TaxID=2094031 RepID=A0ABV7EJD9_9GAMM
MAGTSEQMERADAREQRRGQRGRKAVVAAAFGNVLEWYDFAVYGFLATTIGHHFFPSDSEAAALIATFAVFGVGFIVRPLGGIVIGWIADRRGRKYALLLTLFAMAISTTVIGLIPSAASIGLWAPLLLLVARLVQGFSTGGEWGGSTAFMVEWAPAHRRGFFGSFQQSSVALGLLLGSAVVAVLGGLLGEAAMSDWGWRIPFLMGAVLGPVGLYIRRDVDESPAYEAAMAAGDTHFEATAVEPTALSIGRAARAFGFTTLWTVAYYVMLAYMPTFLQQHAGLSSTQSLWSNTIGLCVLVVAAPLMGALSDRWGRRPLLLGSCAAFFVLAWPLFTLVVASQAMVIVIAVQCLFALMIAMFSGPGPAAIAEMFPTRSRSLWMSTGYSLAVAVFGGFAPLIATVLIDGTGMVTSPTWYLMAAALLSGTVVLQMKETARSELR